jgi:hypothetical protein
MEEFLKATESLSFQMPKKKEGYRFVSDVLRMNRYRSLKKGDKMAVLRYLKKCTGYSKGHLKHLVVLWKQGHLVWNSRREHHSFSVRYFPKDITLLIETDVAHSVLSGEATKRILVREYERFGKKEFENISKISISYLYFLRKHNRQYNSSKARSFTKTRAVNADIGIRRKPRPEGSPGFLRVDTVHQGDRDGEKGVYHINLVDEVTQWELVWAVEGISERFLKPVLTEALLCFPFVLHEFHSDNGSEYINHVVAKLLNKLHVVLSKSRSRKSQDNALVEGKNGAVVRKWFGRNFIERKWAERISAFNREFLNAYLNYHRPCGFATEYTDRKGKIRRKYETWLVPYEKLKSLPNAQQYLKEGVSFEELDRLAYAESDNACATRMQAARDVLFKEIRS